MPTETRTRELLRRAADQLEVGPPPLPALVTAPERRRRRLTLVAVSAAAAAVIAAAVAVAGPGGGGSEVTAPPAQADPLEISPGMELVGLGEIAVEVPDDWTSPRPGCWVSPPGSAVSRLPASPCGGGTDRTELSLLSLGPDRTTWPFRPRDGADVVPGTSAVPMPTFEMTCLSDRCEPTFRGGIVQESLQRALVVDGPDEQLVESILDSARALPAGHVAIPARPTLTSLERLGLTVEVRGSSDAEEYEAIPPPGSIVASGSLVTLVQAPTDGVAITSALGTCGPTDGLALDVAVESDRRLSVYTLLLDGERIIGKQPQILRPGTTNHILTEVIRSTGAGSVTVQVVPTWTGVPIAELVDVPLALAPGTDPCG